ncbi:MAG TPA: DUF6702 family protein [Flavisolibacter sp.]|nr:DUF6702 family protein [Flavisolibacter sp.]
MAVLFYKWMPFYLLSFFSGKGIANEANEAAKHPFYISVTEVSHNATDKTLEISCKFFADDFEQTIEKVSKAALDISLAKDKAAFDKYIPDYVSRHLTLLVDNKPVMLSYVGFEKEKESAFAYFEVKNITAARSISITNSLLHDFTNQQINIMHVTVGGKRQSTKLDYPATKATFTF